MYLLLIGVCIRVKVTKTKFNSYCRFFDGPVSAEIRVRPIKNPVDAVRESLYLAIKKGPTDAPAGHYFWIFCDYSFTIFRVTEPSGVVKRTWYTPAARPDTSSV